MKIKRIVIKITVILLFILIIVKADNQQSIFENQEETSIEEDHTLPSYAFETEDEVVNEDQITVNENDEINENTSEENETEDNIVKENENNEIENSNDTEIIEINDNIKEDKLLGGEIPPEGSIIRVQGKEYLVRHIYDESESFSGGGEIKIDCEFNDWEDKPYVWEYSYDNSYIEYVYNSQSNQYEAHYYLDTDGSPYNNLIRNKIALFTDNEYVYLHVKVAGNYDNGLRVNNWRFEVNGASNQTVEFLINEIENENSSAITLGIGEYEDALCVRHGAGKDSGTIIEDSKVAFVRKTENGNFDEMECRIPLSAFAQQNPKINIDNLSTISVFQSNLMHRKYTISGTSTNPVIGIAIVLLIVSIAAAVNKRRQKV